MSPTRRRDTSGASSTRPRGARRASNPTRGRSRSCCAATRRCWEDLLGALLMIAHTDGVYHPSERAAIAEVGRIFGFGPADIHRIESTFVAGGAASGTDPYEVLGLSRSAADAEVKRAFPQAPAGEPPRQGGRPGPSRGVRRRGQQEDGRDQRRLRPHQGRTRPVLNEDSRCPGSDRCETGSLKWGRGLRGGEWGRTAGEAPHASPNLSRHSVRRRRRGWDARSGQRIDRPPRR